MSNYRVDVLAMGETTWASNALTFETEESARAYAKDLFSRWFAVDKMRIVPTATPQRETYVPGSENL